MIFRITNIFTDLVGALLSYDDNVFFDFVPDSSLLAVSTWKLATMQCVKLSKDLDQTCNVFNPTKLTPSQKAETSVTDDPSTDKPSEGGPTSPINSQDYQEMKRLNR